MKPIKITFLLLAFVAGIVTAVPASAAWYCTAKNAAGTIYGGTGAYRNGAGGKALSSCRSHSVDAKTCKIVNCSLTAG